MANAPAGGATEPDRIALLEAVRDVDKTWENLAPRYGVSHPDPPWKVSLYATCECLSAAEVLPSLERRHAEDALGEAVYCGTPGPELQLLALAHTLLGRGLLNEAALAERMVSVRARLEAAGAHMPPRLIPKCE